MSVLDELIVETVSGEAVGPDQLADALMSAAFEFAAQEIQERDGVDLGSCVPYGSAQHGRVVGSVDAPVELRDYAMEALDTAERRVNLALSVLVGELEAAELLASRVA